MYLLSAAILLLHCGQVFNWDGITKPQKFDPYVHAQSILQATDKKAEMIRIFPHVTAAQIQQIADAYEDLNSGKPLVSREHVPLRGDPFQDLLFAMINPLNYNCATFLYAALHSATPEAFSSIITDIFIIVESTKEDFIKLYNNNPILFSHKIVFKEPLLQTVSKKITNEYYKDFLQQFINKRREPETITWFSDANAVNGTAHSLAEEYKSWENNRTTLNYVLMNKPLQFAQQVIIQFITINGDEHIFTTIDKYIPDKNLKFSYKRLVQYIFDHFVYLHQRIHDSVDEPLNQHTINIMLISHTPVLLWHHINAAFEIKYKQSVGDYLLSKNAEDPVNQMLAALSGLNTVPKMKEV